MALVENLHLKRVLFLFYPRCKKPVGTRTTGRNIFTQVFTVFLFVVVVVCLFDGIACPHSTVCQRELGGKSLCLCEADRAVRERGGRQRQGGREGDQRVWQSQALDQI